MVGFVDLPESEKKKKRKGDTRGCGRERERGSKSSGQIPETHQTELWWCECCTTQTTGNSAAAAGTVSPLTAASTQQLTRGALLIIEFDFSAAHRVRES